MTVVAHLYTVYHTYLVRANPPPCPSSGFENFARNDLEQLLINFTGESLQNTFNKKVFNNELALFEEEGIEVTVSSYPDNTQCLTMLSDRRTGIIPRCGDIGSVQNKVSGFTPVYPKY